MDDVREVFQSFSQVEGFDGWVIGKLCFRFGQWDHETERKQVSVRKQKDNYALLEAVSAHILVQMYILKPQEGSLGKEAEDKRDSQQKFFGQREDERKLILSQYHILLGMRAFSREEILAFVENVGDYNGIHRTDKPVVPAALMTEWLWEEGWLWDREEVLVNGKWAGEKTFAVTIWFHAPAYAGDEIVVYRDGMSGQLWGAVGREEGIVLLWKGNICKMT